MGKVIRILHVFGRLERGGAETMVMNLYRNIDRSKIQFDFVIHTKEKCEYNDEIIALGGRIYSLPAYTGKNHFHYINEWNKLLKEKSEYKIIHGHVRSTASIYLNIAKKYGLTTIAHSHSTSSGFGFKGIVKDVLQYPIRYIADYYIACSKAAGIWLFGEKVCNSENFFILNNAIDTTKFAFDKNIRSKIRKKYNIDENKIVLGHVGRFTSEKNHSFLIDVFNDFQSKNNNSILLLVGDGELRKEIEYKVEKLGLTNKVIFTGVIPNVSELLQAIDIFLFPSIYEGLGLAVIEAQASGAKCVIANTIPKEAYLTNDIKVLSLDDSINDWSSTIIDVYGKSPRKNNANFIKEKGYDITDTTKFIQDFYLGISDPLESHMIYEVEK